MTIETQIMAQNKINEIIDGLVDNAKEDGNLDACGNASDVIDAYETQFPEDREFIRNARNFLSDQTFEAFAAIRKK